MVEGRRSKVEDQRKRGRSLALLSFRLSTFDLRLHWAAWTASRMVFLNPSMPWSKAAAMGITGVRRILRLNFFKLSSATGSSILLATTRRGLSGKARAEERR